MAITEHTILPPEKPFEANPFLPDQASLQGVAGQLGALKSKPQAFRSRQEFENSFYLQRAIEIATKLQADHFLSKPPTKEHFVELLEVLTKLGDLK